MMPASRFTVRLCGFAVALGVGAAIATTQSDTAWADPSDSSSPSSSSASPTDGSQTPEKPKTKRPDRPHLVNLTPGKKHESASKTAETQSNSTKDTPAPAKLTAQRPLAAILSKFEPKSQTITSKTTARLSTPATALATEAPAKLSTATAALVPKAPTAPKAPKPTGLQSVLRGFVSSFLNTSTATSDTPVPADSPAAWATMAFARRELATDPSPISLLKAVISPVATLVFDVFNQVFAAAAGPPVLPPGSTVTVKSSTLEFDNGYTAPADWYFPADENPQGIIYLQHGFLAQGPIYSYTAAALAEQTHSIVVAPTITSNFFAADGNWLGGSTMPAAAADLFEGNREALVNSASAAAGERVTLPQKVVLVGHSLGGGFVTAMAGDMADNGTAGDLAGVVLLDGVAFDPSVPETAFGKLDELDHDVPVLLIASEPYFWNMYGQMIDAMTTLRPGQFNGVQLVGGRHIDGLQGGNPLIQLSEYIVAGFSQPQNVEAVKILSIDWINDMYAGNTIEAPSDQPFQIPTTAGTATAYSIPAPPTQLSPIDQLIKTVESFGTSIFLNA
jgi:acetyl esterase/lipase